LKYNKSLQVTIYTDLFTRRKF